MEHKGVRYQVLRTASPNGWKWVAHVSHTKQITGFSRLKEMAVAAAKRAIEKALAVEKKRDGNADGDASPLL